MPDAAWLAANPESLFPAALAGETLWCTQLWMAFNALMLGLIGLWLLKRRRYFGQAAVTLLCLYAVTRFTIEAFRGDELRGVWFGGALSTSQLISVVGLIVGVGLLVKLRGRRDPALATSGPSASPPAA